MITRGLRSGIDASKPTGKPTTELTLVLEGELPLSGGMLRIECLPAAMTRPHMPRMRAQLSEALTWILSARPSRPRISAYASDGTLLRRTRLLELPGHDGYLVQEVRVDHGQGTIDKWIVGCAADFAPKRASKEVDVDR